LAAGVFVAPGVVGAEEGPERAGLLKRQGLPGEFGARGPGKRAGGLLGAQFGGNALFGHGLKAPAWASKTLLYADPEDILWDPPWGPGARVQAPRETEV